MDVHEYIKTITDNKDNYSRDQYYKLMLSAKEEYEKYLMKKYAHKDDLKDLWPQKQPQNTILTEI